jgi:hypothetical protein
MDASLTRDVVLFVGGLFAANVSVLSKQSGFHTNYSFLHIVETFLCVTGAITSLGSWATLRAAFDEVEHIKHLYEKAKNTFQYRVPPEEAIFGMVRQGDPFIMNGVILQRSMLRLFLLASGLFCSLCSWRGRG